ncbi:MAG: tetratricopeptide repeat protein [Candidatus Omnitrophica bacterium]|nr:tetratricopeptide repeat protein [Candidatus Omnitrophota bacterium]
MKKIFFAVAILFTTRGACAHPDPLENIKIYTYVLETSPENAYAYINRGICYRMVFDYSRAVDDFNRAEELGMVTPYLWMNRAMAYISLHEYDKAMDDLNILIEKEPDNPSNFFYRGELFFRLDDYAQAIEDYTKALELRKAAHLYYVRGDAYSRIGEYDKALADYKQASEIRPYAIAFLLAQGKLLGQMGRLEEARAVMDKATTKQPERYAIYIERAVISASQSLEASREADLKTALKYLDDEIFFRPQDPSVYADQARVYEMMGQPDKALESFQKAIDVADTSAYKYYRLRGEFYRREGETEKANEDLALADELETQPVPTATPLPGPTLSLDQLKAEPTPNLLQGQVPGSQ